MIRDFTLLDVQYLVLALRWTVLLSLIAFVGGGLVGAIVTLMRISRWAPLRWLATGYIELFQGTPLLLQLFVAYFLTSLIGFNIEATPAAALALTLNASAFLAEIWRGSIQAIHRTQWEASASIALARTETLRYVILPQALRIAIPPTVGQLTQIIKGTSLAALIGFVELTREGQLITNVTFQPLLVFSVVAGLYFMVCFPLSYLSRELERRTRIHGTT